MRGGGLLFPGVRRRGADQPVFARWYKSLFYTTASKHGRSLHQNRVANHVFSPEAAPVRGILMPTTPPRRWLNARIRAKRWPTFDTPVTNSVTVKFGY